MIKKITNFKSNFEAILDIYHSVGWVAYTEYPEDLKKALNNSTYVQCFYENGKLIGLIRGLTDDVSVHYIQDIIVHPDAQNKGIGTQLVEYALESLEHVRAHILLTDDEPSQLAFYRKFNFSNTKSLKDTVLNAFVKFRGVKLG